MDRGRAHLDLRDDLFLGRIRVSAVNDADDVRLRTLHESDRSPEDAFPATARIAVPPLSMR